MSEKLRARLEAVPLDAGAEARAWALVRAAHAERAPRRRRAPLRALPVAAVVAAAAVAGTLSSPGRAVVEAVGRSLGIERAAPALVRLPAPGRLLVSGRGGAWVIAADGSRRRLGSFSGAAWSPHALYLAAAGPGGLSALEPDGTVRWALERPSPSLPAWGGTRTDTRIAYLSRGRLHVVAGDGSGDRTLGAAAPVRPAWRPTRPGAFVLAWVTASGHVVAGRPGSPGLWHSSAHTPRPTALAWSPDGRTLAVATPQQLFLFDGRTGVSVGVALPGIRALAYAPDGRLAVVRGRSIQLVGRDGARSTLFSAPGCLAGLAWSPDGRWLLTASPAADQWLFVGPRRVFAVSGIRARLGGAVRLDGWAPGA
ncbi:MAG TPA: hypothetical protein VFJ77_07130 [Gaiellaceae bacterium]|nr:hypothetical protein [Gaiellaceae bacterium]